jgi:hypothetical protein
MVPGGGADHDPLLLHESLQSRDDIPRKAIVLEDLLEQCLSNLESGREIRQRDETP